MKAGPLWKLSLAVAPEAEDAVAELLPRLFGEPASIYTDALSGATTASVYLKNRSAWTPRLRARLAAEMQHLAAAGLGAGLGRCSLVKVRREDWAESWKRHFQPMEIGRALLLKPSWSRRRARRGQAVVVLDPGLSFGTGQHPTTRFCLEQLVAFRNPGEPQSFLDAGTGSGILAIAAAKLGYQPVNAFDCDPEAVRVAKENAALNGASRAVDFACKDLTGFSVRSEGRFNLVCANLTADLLIAARARLLALLSAQGRLVLAGILTSQFAGVRKAYEAEGLRLIAQKTSGEWKSGAFQLACRCQ